MDDRRQSLRMVIFRIVLYLRLLHSGHSPLMMNDKELALKPSGRATFSTGMSFKQKVRAHFSQ